MDILNVEENIRFNEDIVSYEFHHYTAFNTSNIGNSDEVRITMYQADAITLPCESYLYLEGEMVKREGPTTQFAKFINNAFSFLFDNIRFEINSVEVDSVRVPGITSTLKNYISLSPGQIRGVENAGFVDPNKASNLEGKKKFNVILPLKHLMGFFEDYQKVVMNVKQELILVRARSDVDMLIAENENNIGCTVNLKRIDWCVPHVKVSDRMKLKLYKIIERASPISLAFRSWELHEYPNVPSANKISWRVKTSDQLNKPRYVLLAFQTDRRDNEKANRSHFDSADVRNVKLFLNDTQYPYQDLNIEFANDKISQLYENYIRFRSDYYSLQNVEPLLSRLTFKEKTPFVLINCSKQSEAIKDGTVDIRLEIECNKNIPEKTTAYCLILHDKIIEYSILTGLVKRY